ncbi:unnamed protein product [Ranitomeya imitator]|uniref:Uncharacterized protein n=1 Tax=Ranitomeya imitator TaxID=111125 RepID=A0ABN9LJ52_9NEOB|nr:unnamed protein product [Ranitomeya imitator]
MQRSQGIQGSEIFHVSVPGYQLVAQMIYSGKFGHRRSPYSEDFKPLPFAKLETTAPGVPRSGEENHVMGFAVVTSSSAGDGRLPPMRRRCEG